MWAKQKTGFASVLPFFSLSRFFCPFPFLFYFLVLFALFLFPSFFRLSLFLYVPFLVPCLFFSFYLVSLCFSFSFSVSVFFPFSVCCVFPSPFFLCFFPFVLFPFFSCYFSLVFLPSFLFLEFFPFCGETYYIILCAFSFTSLRPLLTNLFFLLHDLRHGQTHGPLQGNTHRGY